MLEATKLLTQHQWQGSDMALLETAAARLRGAGAGPRMRSGRPQELGPISTYYLPYPAEIEMPDDPDPIPAPPFNTWPQWAVETEIELADRIGDTAIPDSEGDPVRAARVSFKARTVVTSEFGLNGL